MLFLSEQNEPVSGPSRRHAKLESIKAHGVHSYRYHVKHVKA
jgi:hypothetical protein